MRFPILIFVVLDHRPVDLSLPDRPRGSGVCVLVCAGCARTGGDTSKPPNDAEEVSVQHPVIVQLNLSRINLSDIPK